MSTILKDSENPVDWILIDEMEMSETQADMVISPYKADFGD